MKRWEAAGYLPSDAVTHAMIAHAKSAYTQMPVAVRGAAASAFGFYLRWWRYGPETDGLVAAALERDSWSREQWRRYREDHLAMTLDRAATRVPYYREHWRQRRANGDTASWHELRHWPVLDKGDVRNDPSAFLADDVHPSQLFRLNSSGTSGTPITTWRSRRTMRAWYALFEARTRRWYDVDRHDRWAIIGGQIVTPANQTKPPFWVWNAGLRQLYLSSLHVNERNVQAYFDAMSLYGVEYMLGYASSMYWLAQMAQDLGVVGPKLSVVISNAEPLLPHQREVIEAVFGCPVRNTYGMSEIVAAATECAGGTMHVWPDAGVIEVLDDAAANVAAGTVGRLVCTGLVNQDMPLIRYEVGDRGAIAAETGATCTCGRRMPRIDRIEGRSSDVLLTADGRRVFWYNAQFYGLPLREGQVVQEALGRIRVNVVPGEGYDHAVTELIQRRIRERLGEVDVDVELLESIPRGPNGKFSVVVNRVHAE